MTSEIKHTAGPVFHCRINKSEKPFAVIARDGKFGQEMVAGYIRSEHDAKRIVTCWNQHDALVEAVTKAERFISGFEDDGSQESISELLHLLRTEIDKAGVKNEASV